MSKPTLYVNLDGPILVPGKGDALIPGLRPADYAKTFLAWAKDRFNVQIVTDVNPRAAFHVTKQLGLPEDAFPVRVFELTKTELLHPKEDFYWVDAELIPSEVNWLAQHRIFDRFLQVDPMKGVTPEHMKALDNLRKTTKPRN